MSGPSLPKPKKKPNPYLGFTWVGWVGVLMLVVLAMAYFRGWDPIYPLQMKVMDTFKISTFWNLASSLAMTKGWCMYTQFGPLLAMPTVAVLVWAPSRLKCRSLWLSALLVAGFAMPLLYTAFVFRVVGLPWPFSQFAFINKFLFVDSVTALAGVLLIGLISRSWILTGIWTLWLSAGWVYSNVGLGTFLPVIWYWPRDAQPYLVAIWNGVLIYATLRWAIHAHSIKPKDFICPTCEYDLTNLPSNTCPECGEDVSVVLREAQALSSQLTLPKKKP